MKHNHNFHFNINFSYGLYGGQLTLLHTLVCVYDSLIQIDACSENISRKTAQAEEHSKAEGEAKVGVRVQQP